MDNLNGSNLVMMLAVSCLRSLVFKRVLRHAILEIEHFFAG
jgi:hypothetical protein